MTNNDTDRGDHGPEPEYDAEDAVFRLEHDFDGDRRLSTTIIVGLEAIALEDPEREATPLFETVDPDALDDLFARGAPRFPRNRGRLTFPVGDYVVRVTAGGEIAIEVR